MIIQDGKLRLETSERTFENVLSLVYHYSTNRRRSQEEEEGLPLELRLPQTLRESDSRQNLGGNSIEIFWLEFWLEKRLEIPFRFRDMSKLPIF